MCTAGKTAPKLVYDFLRFDPQRLSSGNYLTEHPKPAGEGKSPAPGPGACKHEYSIKAAQSVLPPQDSRPQAGTQYKIAVCCRKCMIHADVHISYPRSTKPCPSQDNPLHHLQFQKDKEELTPASIRYGWLCSVQGCHAEVTISFRLPRISQEHRELLAAPERLQRRHDEMVQADPNRDVKLATPLSSMWTLQRYLKDALDPAQHKRRLMANNKLFMASFGIQGREGKAFLEQMGFVFYPEADDDEARWMLPNPPSVDDRLRADGTSLREILEDMELEAFAWICKLALDSKTVEVNPLAARKWPSADRDVERVLGAQDYPSHVSTRAPMSTTVLPYFASLGALPNFTDTLLTFAYDRQVFCDAALSAYYLECLQEISEYRGSETLQTKVATVQSLDVVSRRDLRAAYQWLNVNSADSDEVIANNFSARQSSCGAQAKQDNKQQLGKIGMARRSQRLIKASRGELETYEDALNWLGAEKSTDDDFVATMLTTKVMDDQSNQEMANKAATIIARERKSTVLDDWLTGKSSAGNGANTMSVNEALRLLNIELDIKGLKGLDQATLEIIFTSARADRAGTQTENAIAAIQKALSTPSTSSRPPELWPVGLTSHGNTCYLNSLLQYYFSVKPLRDIVLNYDNFKLDTSKHSEKAERVGQRIITTVEIQGGQRFADDLKHLFERMIKDRRPHVKPEEDLVCRAFLEPKDYALLTSEIRGEKNEAKPNGVDTPMADSTVQESTDQEANGAIHKPDGDDTQQSDASSVTLVDDGDVAMKDNDSVTAPPTSPAGPPPLPPRRLTTTKQDALLKAQQNARLQQDVTEVHDGAMFRLRSGMVPKGMDQRGEQQDELRDIFEISLKETTVQENGSEKSKLEANSSITTDVPNESTDVYVLLDKVFDLQDIPGTNKTTYKTIETAPPLLQIAIPRIGYDITRGGAFKSEELVLLHDELYLDRYMDDGDKGQVLPKRRTCWGWRKQLHAWKQERNSLSKTQIEQNGPTALTESASFLRDLGDEISNDLEDVQVGGIDVEPDLADDLTHEAARAASRITELQHQIDELQAKFNQQFAELKQEKYDLAAVFIHRGGNASGHYWIYIRDFGKDCWRKYNDEEVTELKHAELHEMMRSSLWNNGTATYAVYVKASEHAMVDPVCREPEEEVPIVWNSMNNAGEASKGKEVETVTEGGKSLWDESRQVPAGVAWS